MHKGALRRTLLLIVAICLFAPLEAQARSMIDVDRDSSMVVDYNYDAEGVHVDIPDADFRVYRVGDVDEYCRFTLTSEYSGYPVDYSEMETVDDWNKLAYTFEGYIDRDQPKPLKEVTTGSDGTVKVTGIKPGLYIVLGGKTVYGKYIYTPIPTLVMIPQMIYDDQGNETNEWNYDVTMSPKVSRVANPDKDEICVMKSWKNTDGIKHPDSVKVNLYRDGKLFDTATLNADNDWKYSWEVETEYRDPAGSFRAYRWSVSEDEVKDYKVAIDKNDGVYVITNTYAGTTPEEHKLPQTGLLWWPVLAMLAVGICFIIAGMLRGDRN